MINSSYFEIPLRLARMMEEGVYTFIGFKESLIYKILPSGANRLHRFTKQLKQYGYKIGDNILLQVNPNSKTIKIKKLFKPIDDTRPTIRKRSRRFRL